MNELEKTNKEQASHIIFGVNREDACVLGSLTNAQETALSETLALIDRADTIYEQNGGCEEFARAFNQANEKYKATEFILPKKDLRTVLLRTTLKAYEDLNALIKADAFDSSNENAAAIAAIARMRKLFLRKILNNTLDTDAQDFLGYLLGKEFTGTAGTNTHIKIPLTYITRTPSAQAHVFPLQVSIQTQEFIQAVLFYAMFADTAAGEYVRLPQGLKDLENILSKEGLSKQEWDRGWMYLQKYQPIFNNTIYQNVLILMRSHWDWYIRQIGEFVSFARGYVTSPILDKTQQKNLERIGWREITMQLVIIEAACGLKFNLPSITLSDIYEMSLVRNLGMHNRWEVDQFYLKRTSKTNWEIKDVRIIEIGELRSWAKGLSELINETSLQIAIKYRAAPDFP